MSNLSHPNIVRLYGITLKPLALIMELMAFGDLHDLLEPLYKAHTHTHTHTPPRGSLFVFLSFLILPSGASAREPHG